RLYVTRITYRASCLSIMLAQRRIALDTGTSRRGEESRKRMNDRHWFTAVLAAARTQAGRDRAADATDRHHPYSAGAVRGLCRRDGLRHRAAGGHAPAKH